MSPMKVSTRHENTIRSATTIRELVALRLLPPMRADSQIFRCLQI